MKSGIRKIGTTSNHLAKSILLEESGSPTIVRLIIVFIALIFGIFLYWAINAEVDEVAIAVGETLPVGQVQLVQSIAGGVITEIRVKNGQLVEKGDVLIRLDPTMTRSELGQILAKRDVLLVQKERLNALLKGVEPNFSAISKMSEIVQAEWNQFIGIRRYKETNQELFRNRIAQQQVALNEIIGQEKALLEQDLILQEEIAMRKVLYEKKLNSKIVLLSLQRRTSELHSEIEALKPKKEQVYEKIKEIRSQQAEFEEQNNQTLLKELSGIEEKLAGLREDITMKREAASHMEIMSPVSGVIHSLQINTVGAVVSPGSLVLEIVPRDRALMAEIQISTQEIGHVHQGAPVNLKFTTYNYSIYGTIIGELLEISAYTLLDRAGKPYYKGIVKLPKNHLGEDPRALPILPGMTLQADIKTGQKTVMQYLLKPIFKSAGEAFRER